MVMGELVLETEVLVIGSGPGGYAAAFRAADLGLDVTMVDPSLQPGGVCLFQGCIPSKTFLFLSELIEDARRAGGMGVSFGEPEIDLNRLRSWRDEVVNTMAEGLVSLCRRRGIELISGMVEFESSHTVRLSDSSVRRISFKYGVIATGSCPVPLPRMSFEQGSRIMDSTGALALEDIPQSLLVIGGGYIGLELGTLYAGLGSRVRLVESEARLLTGVDRDLVVPLERRLSRTFESIRLSAAVRELRETGEGVEVVVECGEEVYREKVDRVLVAIGRVPRTGELGLENIGISTGDRGRIVVDEQQRTAVPHIFAVGDVTGQVMLAHTASRAGKVAAEVISGLPSAFDVRAIPAVVYTDPQIAWCGLTEEQAERGGIAVEIKRFPWKYSGRAKTIGSTDGLTKMLVDPDSGRVLGLGITGRNAEEMISEGVLAIEMGALAEDLALSMHPHPTLSETEEEAAELFLGNATHYIADSR